MTYQDNKIIQEISEMAPILASLPKSEIHRVPDSYFDEVEVTIINQLNFINEEIQEVIDLPTDYFEKLDDKILQRLSGDRDIKVISLLGPRFNYLKYAAILVFFIASIVLFKYVTPSENIAVTSQLTQAEVLDYMVDNAEDFDINMLIDQEIIDESTLDDISYISVDEEASELIEADF